MKTPLYAHGGRTRVATHVNHSRVESTYTTESSG
jgi:hypothetical protein